MPEMRRLLCHRMPALNNIARLPWIKGNVNKLTVVPQNSVVKNFTLTPAQISASSVGFRADPAGGTLEPNADFGGGTIILAQATIDDEFRIENSGGVPFAETSGKLYVRIGPYVGYSIILMPWDVNRYSAAVPGIYNYLVSQIGLPTGMVILANRA